MTKKNVNFFCLVDLTWLIKINAMMVKDKGAMRLGKNQRAAGVTLYCIHARGYLLSTGKSAHGAIAHHSKDANASFSTTGNGFLLLSASFYLSIGIPFPCRAFSLGNNSAISIVDGINAWTD